MEFHEDLYTFKPQLQRDKYHSVCSSTTESSTPHYHAMVSVCSQVRFKNPL